MSKKTNAGQSKIARPEAAVKERSKTPCPFCGELGFVTWDEWQGFEVGHACDKTKLLITTRDCGEKQEALDAWDAGVSTPTTREKTNTGQSHCYALDWAEGCPGEPGVYLFRIPKGHGLSGLELMMKLCEPDGYDWFVVTVVRDEAKGWLEYVSPRDGQTRIANGEFGHMSVWWAKLPEEVIHATS